MNDQVYFDTGASRAPAFLYRRISWGAVFAGLLVTIVFQLTLTLLGASIGAATINPTQEQDPASGLALGSAIWLLVTGLISMFAGAWVAGRMSGGPRRADGLLHGLVTWSAVTIAMIYMFVTTAGAVIGGLGSLVGGAFRASAQAQPSQDTIASVKENVQEMFPQTERVLSPTGREPGTPAGELASLAQQDPQLAGALARMEAAGGANASAQNRDEVVGILVNQHGMDQQQAMGMVSQWGQQSQQMRSTVSREGRQTGEAAAGAVSQGALWGFIALLLGGAIAAWGGWAGTASLPRRVEAAPVPTV